MIYNFPFIFSVAYLDGYVTIISYHNWLYEKTIIGILKFFFIVMNNNYYYYFIVSIKQITIEKYFWKVFLQFFYLWEKKRNFKYILLSKINSYESFSWNKNSKGEGGGGQAQVIFWILPKNKFVVYFYL